MKKMKNQRKSCKRKNGSKPEEENRLYVMPHARRPKTVVPGYEEAEQFDV